MTKHYCDRCGKEMPTTTEGYWRLSHSDSEPWKWAVEICWSCYYILFPSADVKLGGK